jgi:rhodanese-related sulfurtransferase
VKTIDRHELKSWYEGHRDFTIVEVLGMDAYTEFHLPGAVNVPIGRDDFDGLIQKAAPDRSQTIVVYCYDRDCTASPKAAERLERLGYSDVYDYEAGKMDWKDAGQPIEL